MIDKELHKKIDSLIIKVNSIEGCLKGYSVNGNDGLIKRVAKLENRPQKNIPLYALLISAIPTGLIVVSLIVIILTKLGGLW